MTINIFVTDCTGDNKEVIRLLKELLAQGKATMAGLTELETAVQQESTVVDSVERLVNDLATQIRNANGDQAKINQILEKVTANKSRLAQAVVQNTDADTTGGGNAPDPTPVDTNTGGGGTDPTVVPEDTTGGTGGVDPTTGLRR